MARRLIGNVVNQPIGPLFRLHLALLVGGHGGVACSQVLAHDERTSKIVDEAADAPPANHGVQSVIDFGIDGNGELLLKVFSIGGLDVDESSQVRDFRRGCTPMLSVLCISRHQPKLADFGGIHHMRREVSV